MTAKGEPTSAQAVMVLTRCPSGAKSLQEGVCSACAVHRNTNEEPLHVITEHETK